MSEHLKRNILFSFQEKNYALPEMEDIHKYAHWLFRSMHSACIHAAFSSAACESTLFSSICKPTSLGIVPSQIPANASQYSSHGRTPPTGTRPMTCSNVGSALEPLNFFSTSTRNFDDRIGNGARVFLGSAELGAVAVSLGRLPTPAEYFAAYQEKIAPRAAQVYRYLQFDELAEYKPAKGRTVA